MRIALTGGIACGKSTFSAYLQRLGVEVLDADVIVHQLQAPGGAAVPELVAAFGEAIIDQSGGVDRGVLAELVFGSERQMQKLNAIVHPFVREALRDWIGRPSGKPRVAVIPLLFEVGWESDWDFIVCLAASEATQLERLMRHRSLSLQQARRRLAAQMPATEKAALADLVVWNDHDSVDLDAEAARIHQILMEITYEHRERSTRKKE